MATTAKEVKAKTASVKASAKPAAKATAPKKPNVSGAAAKLAAAPVKKAAVAAKPAAVKKDAAPAKVAATAKPAAVKPALKKTMLKRELDTKVRSLSALINEVAVEAEAHGFTLVYSVVDGKIVPMLSKKK